ncbi:hypothetical protein SCLCIDRAFT_1220979 [Scleroderma citrinum Foug A]|uniref:Uncharacterized protein n=1 Tax=Scleroderma citrinum Foug A TaxID=1036808 RepID=A0A0C3D4J7_9AGAM|nr:hypothetical protein SCLCIDRAFT_1220979 [Scleroderma citrinum Foug A]
MANRLTMQNSNQSNMGIQVKWREQLHMVYHKRDENSTMNSFQRGIQKSWNRITKLGHKQPSTEGH